MRLSIEKGKPPHHNGEKNWEGQTAADYIVLRQQFYQTNV